MSIKSDFVYNTLIRELNKIQKNNNIENMIEQSVKNKDGVFRQFKDSLTELIGNMFPDEYIKSKLKIDKINEATVRRFAKEIGRDIKTTKSTFEFILKSVDNDISFVDTTDKTKKKLEDLELQETHGGKTTAFVKNANKTVKNKIKAMERRWNRSKRKDSAYLEMLSDFRERVYREDRTLKSNLDRLVSFQGGIAFLLDENETNAYCKKQIIEYKKLIKEAIADSINRNTELFRKYKHLATGDLASQNVIKAQVKANRSKAVIVSLEFIDRTNRRYGSYFEYGTKPKYNIKKRNKPAKRRAKRIGDSFKLNNDSLTGRIYDWITAKQEAGTWDSNGRSPIRNEKEKIKTAFAISRAIIANGTKPSWDVRNRPQLSKPKGDGMIEYILRDIMEKTRDKMIAQSKNNKAIRNYKGSYRRLLRELDNMKYATEILKDESYKLFELTKDKNVEINPNANIYTSIYIKNLARNAANIANQLTTKNPYVKEIKKAIKVLNKTTSFQTGSTRYNALQSVIKLLEDTDNFFRSI